MNELEKTVLAVEITSLTARAETIEALMKIHADQSSLAQELAIIHGQIDRLKSIARQYA